MNTYPLAQPVNKTVEDLIKEGYLSISNKYRLLARCPPDKDPRDLLCQQRQWVNRLTPAQATSHFARVYSKDLIELTATEWADFKRSGGKRA